MSRVRLPTWGDRLAKDTDFHQKMCENPALWEAIKGGRVTVHSDIAIARRERRDNRL